MPSRPGYQGVFDWQLGEGVSSFNHQEIRQKRKNDRRRQKKERKHSCSLLIGGMLSCLRVLPITTLSYWSSCFLYYNKDWNLLQANFVFIFVLRRKGSERKKRMKEEEIERGDCGPPTPKVFFCDFVGLEPDLRMVRWCIRLTRVTLVCEVIRYRFVQVRQNHKKNFVLPGTR